MIMIFSLAYLIVSAALVIHSFTQTQNLLSGSTYLILFTTLFACYFYFLKKGRRLPLLILIGPLAALILTLCYPLFLSEDPVSYLFYSKTLFFYHQLPWFTAPANFPHDPWLAKNHWPTSPSRYGPVWIALTGLPYLFAAGDLIKGAYLLKIVGLIGYLGNIFILSRLKKSAAFLYAANPYILLESAASPHTDVWVTFFVLLAIWKRSSLALLLSIATKIVSLPLLIPVIIQRLFRLNTPHYHLVCLMFAYLGSAIIIARWSINPWYLYLPITLSSLLWENKFIRYSALSLSVAATMRYLPYLYMGFFDPNNKIRAFLFLLFLVPLAVWTVTEVRKWLHQEIP